MPTLAECERPLKTGRPKPSRSGNRTINRRQLRDQFNALQEMFPGLRVNLGRRQSLKTKPYHRTSCPGEWRWWSATVKYGDEEFLVTNIRARTALEVRQKVVIWYGNYPSETRQQPSELTDGYAEVWWDR